jgi:hypothetical protein
VVTEFSCQGLGLDLAIVCWGNDFTWDGEWKSPPVKRSKAKDPHQLWVNSYRVLLTRDRDGLFIFVPKEVGMETTNSALVGAGAREIFGDLASVEKGNHTLQIRFFASMIWDIGIPKNCHSAILLVLFCNITSLAVYTFQ